VQLDAQIGQVVAQGAVDAGQRHVVAHHAVDDAQLPRRPAAFEQRLVQLGHEVEQRLPAVCLDRQLVEEEMLRQILPPVFVFKRRRCVLRRAAAASGRSARVRAWPAVAWRGARQEAVA
jgi:hypothetical protein